MANLEQTLEELGFTPVPQLNAHEQERKHALQQKLTAAEGAPREDSNPAPQFFHMQGKTFALCSYTSRWFKDEVIDLTAHGFNDVNAQMRDIVRKVQ